MTEKQNRRRAINAVLEDERKEFLGRTLTAEEIRNDPQQKAERWAMGMFAELKRFGDRKSDDAYLKHFEFDAADPSVQEFHERVHTFYRSLIGIEFIDLTDERTLQATIGGAALFAIAKRDETGDLQSVWYDAELINSQTSPPTYQSHFEPSSEQSYDS